jgi:hypothetical protein
MNCCVCGRSGSDVTENTCSLTNQKAPYCLDCWWSGREPYDELVAFGWEFEQFNTDYQQRIIKPTLDFRCKSIQQFNEEVSKKRMETHGY